jgi:hypothetical protein
MNAPSVRNPKIRTDLAGLLMDGVDFKAWFGKSRAVDAGRAPVLVFRGEHGEADIPLVGAHSRRGALSFGSLAAANVYAADPNDPIHDQTAAAPRVVPAFLRIEHPLIDTPEDPFLELSVLRQALGPAQCRRIAAKFADAIADTGNWDEHFAPRFPSVAAFLEQASDDDLDELYFYAYRLMDDPQEVELLRQAGFDGAIHGGAGSNALEPEYKVFSPEQVLPAIAAGWPLRPEPRREAPKLTPDGQQPSTVTRVRQAIAQLVGTGVSELREGLGRFVVTTSQEVVGQPLLARSAGVLRSAGGTSAFQQMLLERQAACDRAIKAIGAVDDCAIVRHEGGQRWMMILRDASSPGNWRTQSFDAVGFSGHMTFATKALAIEAAAQAKYTVRDDGALDRLQDTPEFQRGLFVTDVTRLWNLGEITFEEAQQRVAAYDETTAVLQSMALQSAKAFYAPASGTMYMLADRIAQGAEKSVFLHEVVHKHGRKTLGTHGWNRMVGAVKRWEQAPAGSIERVIHFAAHARAAGAVGLADVDLYEEELFAYAVEEAVSRGVKPSAEATEGSAENWLADVTATLRGVVMQLTAADPPPLAAQELVDLAYALAQLENPARSQELLRELGPELAGQVRQLAARAGRPVWYSALKAEVDALPARAQTPAHWLRWISGLKRRGVSQSEIEWSGITNWLAAVTGPVSPAQMSAFLGANGVQLQEVLKGGTHAQREADRIRVELDALGYTISDGNSPLLTRRSDGAVFAEHAGSFAPEDASYLPLARTVESLALAFSRAYGETIDEDGTRYSHLTIPGGEHYSELLLTLPVRRDVVYTRENVVPMQVGGISSQPDLFWYFEVPGNVLQIPKSRYADQEAALQYILADKQPDPPADKNYKSSHWSELNIVGHVRFNERQDLDGRRVLFIEELQSDYGADYRDAKEQIRHAVDNDFEGIVARMKVAGVLEVNCD